MGYGPVQGHNSATAGHLGPGRDMHQLQDPKGPKVTPDRDLERVEIGVFDLGIDRSIDGILGSIISNP